MHHNSFDLYLVYLQHQLFSFYVNSCSTWQSHDVCERKWIFASFWTLWLIVISIWNSTTKTFLTLVVSLESSFLLNWKQNQLWAAGCVGCDLVGGYLGHSVTKRKCRPYDIYNQSKCSETFKNPLFFHKRGENVKYYRNLRQKKIIDTVNKLRSGQTYDSGSVHCAMQWSHL